MIINPNCGVLLVERIVEICAGVKQEQKCSHALHDAAKLEADPGRRYTFDLLAKSLSLGMSGDDVSEPFAPMVVLYNIGRSPSLDDFTEEDIDALVQLSTLAFPALLSARINDILWVKRKLHTCAEKAVQQYLELHRVLFDQDDLFACENYIKRANVIANQLGRRNLSFNLVCDQIDDSLALLSKSEPHVLSLSLIEMQLSNNQRNYNCYIAHVDSIIERSLPDGYQGVIEEAFRVKRLLLAKANRQSDMKESQLQLAQYYVEQARRYETGDAAAVLMRAIHFYELTIPIYRNCAESKKADDVLRILEPLKKRAMDGMQSFSSSMDMREHIEAIEEMLSGGSFEECIIHLVQNTPIPRKQALKEEALNRSRSLTELISTPEYLDANGKRIATFPQIDRANPEETPIALEMRMHRCAREEADIQGWLLNWFLHFIRRDHPFGQDDLNFIFNDNAIIPADRTDIIKQAMMLGLQGEYYAALHILVPQMEHVFREIAHMCGAVTTTFEDDRTEQAKTLSSVFELPELVECYDENILFVMKGLLNEKAGSNLRNRIAHGIMSNDEGNSGVAVYFICLCLRIFSWYSDESCKMINEHIQKMQDATESTAEQE